MTCQEVNHIVKSGMGAGYGAFSSVMMSVGALNRVVAVDVWHSAIKRYTDEAQPKRVSKATLAGFCQTQE